MDTIEAINNPNSYTQLSFDYFCIKTRFARIGLERSSCKEMFSYD